LVNIPNRSFQFSSPKYRIPKPENEQKFGWKYLKIDSVNKKAGTVFKINYVGL